MAAVYSIFTSPLHEPVKDHLPTLIVCPHGRPNQILYTYLHTNLNQENYLLTPSEQGDLCVAKLFPPPKHRPHSPYGTTPPPHANAVRCEASRNLKWSISNTGIQNPVYKLTLPNPDAPQQDQPLFQVSKPNPNATWWTLFYFTYAGHLIPPKRVEFGRIQKNSPESGGGTRVSITGKSEEEKAVWKTLGEGNEDMVEWVVLSASLIVVDDEIVSAAQKAGLGLSGVRNVRPPPGPSREPSAQRVPQMQQMPIGSSSSGSIGRPPPSNGQRLPPNGQQMDPRAQAPRPHPPPRQDSNRAPSPAGSNGRPYPPQSDPRRPVDPRHQIDHRQQQQQQQQQDPRYRPNAIQTDFPARGSSRDRNLSPLPPSSQQQRNYESQRLPSPGAPSPGSHHPSQPYPTSASSSNSMRSDGPGVGGGRDQLQYQQQQQHYANQQQRSREQQQNQSNLPGGSELASRQPSSYRPGPPGNQQPHPQQQQQHPQQQQQQGYR